MPVTVLQIIYIIIAKYSKRVEKKYSTPIYSWVIRVLSASLQ